MGNGIPIGIDQCLKVLREPAVAIDFYCGIVMPGMGKGRTTTPCPIAIALSEMAQQKDEIGDTHTIISIVIELNPILPCDTQWGTNENKEHTNNPTSHDLNLQHNRLKDI